MRLHRFFVEGNLEAGPLVLRDEELINQLRNVLRMRAGEKIVLCDSSGSEAQVQLVGFLGDRVQLQVLEISANQNEPRLELTLYCALLKKENFELVAQKVTEVGVKKIVPILTKRTVKLNSREDRLLKITKEAAEQSGRAFIPEIAETQDFDKAIAQAKSENSLNLFFHLGGELLREGSIKGKPRVGIFIGPEGGWEDDEVQKARENQFLISKLGSLTLRAETAAIVASFQVLAFSQA